MTFADASATGMTYCSRAVHKIAAPRNDSMTKRRAVIAGLVLVPLEGFRSTRAQPARKVYRIGIIALGSTADLTGPNPRSPYCRALLRGLRELGYGYGENFVTEARGSEDQPDRFPDLAAQLVSLQVDVIVGVGPALRAIKLATSTIPVVMAGDGDPVGRGYVNSLAHPGGNFTGLSLQSVALTGKRLELLKEIAPRAAPVAVLWDRSAPLYWQAAEAAARERGWRVLSLEIRNAGEIDALFKAATDAHAGALLVYAAGILFTQATRVAALAAGSGLPAMYELRPYAETGGLISYGADVLDIWRHSAVFVHKILMGARPDDLPVEQPTKFELVINLKTAKAMGLTIPRSLLLRADEVIE